jgi:phosphohistidine phosphatase
MKKLIILRHSKSSWNNPELSDFDRPLNNRGNKNAEMMSIKLSHKIDQVDMLMSSSSERTKSTSYYFKKKIKFSNEVFADELYHASSERIISIIEKIKPNINSLLILGHNPGLTEIINVLTNYRLYNLPTTGIVIIKLNIKLWNQISELNYPGEVEWIKFPKDYKL